MDSLIIIVVLWLFMLGYFRLASHYNIIDKPNHRSAHIAVTLRGGGVVYFFALLLYFGSFIFFNGVWPNQFWIFFVGFFLISAISFLDDIIDLSAKIRLLFHFISVSFLLYFVDAFELLPLWLVPLLYILVIGVLNAYNFMDGINGITGLYSLVVLGTLGYVNTKFISFTEKDFILYPILATLVFLYFNFRKKARCFMGDVGSMGISFWILALLGLLMIKTQELKYILFLAVYGIEVIFTLVERLALKENIFEAHRRHLYQLLVHEKKVPHLWVSTLYASVQAVINLFVLSLKTNASLVFLITLLPLSIVYLFIKQYIKKYENKRDAIK